VRNTFDRPNGSQISTNSAAFEGRKFYTRTLSRLPLTIKKIKENSSKTHGNNGVSEKDFAGARRGIRGIQGAVKKVVDLN